MTGLFARPADTLLLERALDYLAGGPAHSVPLVEHVCQQPGTPPAIAERMALAILDAHPDVVRDQDGRWRRASRQERDAAGLLAGEAGGRRVAEPPPAPAVPTFEEWMAARRKAEVSGDVVRQAEAPRPRRARASSPVPRPASEVAPPARVAEPAFDRTLTGDEDALHELSYVVVDVETTGGSPFGGHRITEVAAVRVERGEVKEVFETLVNPERSIPPMISQLTNITWEMVRDKPKFREVAPELLRFLGGHVFVAHNVTFDWKFVSAEIERATGAQIGGRRLCTVRLSRKLLPQLPRRTLGHVARYFDADTAAEAYFAAHHPQMVWRHRAAGDAVATAHCLVRLLQNAASHGCTTWGALDRLLAGGTSRARRPRRSSLALPRGVDRDTTA